MSAGVSSAMSEFWSAHSPITARPASVKPMNVAPPSPRKILARPGRKLYGRKPRHAPTNAADRYMRYRWPVWSAAMLMKMPAITPRPAASPSIPSRNWTALVTVTNHRIVRPTLIHTKPGTQLGMMFRTTPKAIAAAAAPMCPRSLSEAGRSVMSSSTPIPTTSVAPTATPLSCSEKSKLVSTVTANAP